MQLVSLLTDFGLKDPYVAEMKLVLIKNCPDAVLVDITHQVERHNIVEGAFLLEMAVPFFPGRTVHLAVVDPGVGSARLPVVVECRRGHVLVGPDNGLLVRAAETLGYKQAYRMENPRFLAAKCHRHFMDVTYLPLRRVRSLVASILQRLGARSMDSSICLYVLSP